MTKQFTVEFTREAEEDLEAIHAYVLEYRSVEQADALIEQLVRVAVSLETFPMRGAVPKELKLLARERYRQIQSPPYRLMYRVIETRVFVSLIVDGRRDLPELLARRLLGR